MRGRTAITGLSLVVASCVPLTLAGMPGAAGAGRAAPAVARLTAVRAAAHPGYDRLVFQFAGPVPATHSVAWARRVVQDPSGRPVALRGQAFLRIVFRPATAHTAAGAPTYPGKLPTRFDLPALASAEKVGDFENVLSFGVGLWWHSSVRVLTLARPSRVVVDVRVPAAPPTRLTAIDNGRLVFLRVGQHTTVALRVCVSCGDVWNVATSPRGTVVRIVSSSVVPLPHTPGAVGFPYEHRWSLRATGVGRTHLELVERGPQRGAAPLRRFAVRLRVTR